MRLFLYWLVNVGLCAHQHAPDPTIPPMFAHQACTQRCLVHADLMDYTGPLQDDFPTAIKIWLLVVEEVSQLQKQLLELQAIERECRLQAEQQKLGMWPQSSCMALHQCQPSCGRYPEDTLVMCFLRVSRWCSLGGAGSST